ncbi:MAG: START-like domain-containing protein [Microbacter sp.]
MKKEKIQLEYVFQNISINVLWNHISTASGLAEWFADKVEAEGRMYHFKWGDYSQEAEMIQLRLGSLIRFRWTDDEERTYFEFKLMVDELVPQVALIITDFALPEDKTDTIMLWNKQIGVLKQRAGI